MSSKTKKAAVLPDAAPGQMTYSVRFSEAERLLLARAAAIKSWSPTNLIREAALESAASIVNTSTQPAFKRLALMLSEQALKPRFYTVRAREIDGEANEEYSFRASEAELGALVDEAGPGPRIHVLGVHPETPQLPREVVLEITKAAKHGGAEFIRAFFEYSEGFSATDKIDDTKIVVNLEPE